jgi:hypothetical protein
MFPDVSLKGGRIIVAAAFQFAFIGSCIGLHPNLPTILFGLFIVWPWRRRLLSSLAPTNPSNMEYDNGGGSAMHFSMIQLK